MYVQYKDWIKYEIDESVRLGKPIFAIIPRGNTVMPSYVSKVANETVNWDTNSIVSAIIKLAK